MRMCKVQIIIALAAALSEENPALCVSLVALYTTGAAALEREIAGDSLL